MGFGSPSLKGKALQWLAQREHSRAELQSKLLRHVRKVSRQAEMQTLTSTSPQKDPPGRGFAGRHGFDPVAEPVAGWGDAPCSDPAEAAAVHCALEQAKIAQVLDDLAAAGLQSDTRTAQSMARTKGSRYGVHRLKQQLQAKGLASELVAHTVAEARGSEFERALDIWRRRYGEPAQDPAERMRQVRFLTARGFDGDIVRRVVRGAQETD